jgi:predicted amidohydrolase
VCGANRIGVDNLCLEYNGQSAIFDFKGKTLATADNDEKIIIAEFDKEALEKFRRKFPVWKDADMFEIR